METKKLVRKVVIASTEEQIEYKVGEISNLGEVVAINFDDFGVQIFFRAEDEKPDASTPKKMEDRPMRYFHGFPFIVQDVLQ